MNEKRADNREEGSLQDIFVSLLGAELRETEPSSAVKARLTPHVISALYRLSKQHDLTHVVSSALYKNGVTPEPSVKAEYERETIMAVFRHEQMQYAYEKICRALDKAEVAYLPLKGAVVRPYYPEASMRTGCDIDILVKETELESAIKALVCAEYRCGDRNYHDVSLHSPEGIHLELHFSLCENIDTLDEVLKDAWHYVVPAADGGLAFSEPFFVFHMFAHMAYHFLSGGCGARSLMDVWVMKHKMGLYYSRAKTLLEKAGIYRFAVKMSELSEACFSDQPRDELSHTLLTYILSGGVYGSCQNQIAVKREDAKSTLGYSMRRLFLPYDQMIIRFPHLKKLPFLLPFYWAVRIFKMILGGNMRRSVDELRAADKMSQNELERIKTMREILGL